MPPTAELIKLAQPVKKEMTLEKMNQCVRPGTFVLILFAGTIFLTDSFLFR
jgi:hypothetical protein